MFNNSKEFLRSLVDSKKEVSIWLRPAVLPWGGGGNVEVRGRIVWFDNDAIGVEFVKEDIDEKERKNASTDAIVNIKKKKKVVLYFKSAIDCIEPGWEEEKEDILPI